MPKNKLIRCFPLEYVPWTGRRILHGGRAVTKEDDKKWGHTSLKFSEKWLERSFEHFSRSSIHIDLATALRRCGNPRALSDGKCIHDHIIKIGLERDAFLRNLTIQMYGNCGALDDARDSFVKMHRKDLFSWNLLMTAYARHGQGKQTLELVEQMQQEGVMVDQFTLCTVLRACASQGASDQGRRIHARIMGCKLKCDVILETALLDMYGKCGSLEDAQLVFDSILERDVVVWTAIIAIHAQHGRGQEAVQLFEQMQQDRLIPDKFILISILSACVGEGALPEGKRMHEHIRGSEFELDTDIGNALVYMYGKCGSLDNAHGTFDKMLDRNIVTWNTIISVNVQHGLDRNALQLFEQMECEGALPDKVTFVSILGACTTVAAEGRRLHARISGSEFESDVVLWTAMVTMYGRCGKLEDACRMLNEIPKRNVVSWNAMIAAYAHHGQIEEALESVERMQGEGIKPNKITFLTMLDACATQDSSVTGQRLHTCIMETECEVDVGVETAIVNMYGKRGSLYDAQRMFEKMPERNEATFVSILSACASQASLAAGKCVHACIVGSEFESNIVVGTALVYMYGKCGSLEDAQRHFENIQKHDVVLWNALIVAYAQNGKGQVALLLFSKMQERGITPNEITCVNILSACSHTGLVDDGCRFFFSMIHDFCIVPSIDHYNCMIDILGRTGQFDEMEELLCCMPIKPTVVSWLASLGACQHHVDTERAERVVKHLVELDPENAVPFVMLSNVYAVASN